ncbi:MAG TPA: hypothetical protein VF275_02005 [Gammaproteobacteria bacterium]
MKTQQHRRFPLLPAMLAAALVPQAYAGDVTISTIDPATGAMSTYAEGSTPHKPTWLFEGDENVMVPDACGVMYEVKTGAYGDREIVDMQYKDRSFENVRIVWANERAQFAIGNDGKPWSININDNYGSTETHEFAVSYDDSPLDFSRTRLFVGGMGEVPTLAFFDDGRLLSTKEMYEREAQARFVAPRTGWGHIQQAAPVYVGSGRERRAVLITIDDKGRMARHEPIEEAGDGFDTHVTSMKSTDVNGTFAGTRAIFATRRDEFIYRWTDGGDLFALDPMKGTEKRIGDAGAFKGDFMVKPEGQIYLVSSAGSFAACAEKAAPVVEAPKDTSIIAATDEIIALKVAHYFPLDGVIREPLPNMSGEFKTIEPTIKTLFDKITEMEDSVVTPIREKTAAYVAKYGEESAAESALREVTGKTWYLDGNLDALQKVIKRWDAYKTGVADTIAQQANTSFVLGEHASDRAARSEHYRAAKPWAEWALRFDPSHQRAAEMLAKADEQAGSADAAFAAAIQNAKWPADITDVPDAAALKKKMLSFFQRRHNGGAHDKGARYFAIRLDSRWYVQARNVLGEPIDWRISAWVAETVPGDAKHARIHWLEAGTNSPDKNAEFSYTTGASDSYLIPIERVPADDAAMLKESHKLLGH